MRRTRVALAFMLTLLVAAVACAQQNGVKPCPLRVVVTIAPLKGLVEPLLPDGSTVTVLMQPGKSEHGYEFTPADVAAVAKADLVVYVGLGLEGRIEEAAKRQSAGGRRVVCFADAVGIKPGPAQDGEDEHQEKGDEKKEPKGGEGHHHHEHEAGYVDPHLWLDPVLVGKLIDVLEPKVHAATELSTTGGCGWGVDVKALQQEFERASAAATDLRERIQAVDKEWTDRLAPLKGRSVVTHHNAFSRPAERYGFKVAAVIREFETSEPSPGDIAKVVEAIRKEHVKTIFVEPQFNGAAAERIAAKAGVKVGHLDPLGDGDWFKMMKSNLDALVAGLSDDARAAKPAEPGGGGK
jgi:zinc transport system substrate-binding protein